MLVTGAGGFIGGHLVRALLNRGVELHAQSRTGRALDPRATWHACDLNNADATQRLLADVRPSHLVHMAWPVVAGNWAEVGHDANLAFVEAGLSLVRAFAKSGGERLVVAGSCTEYDWSTGRLLESSPRRPQTFYGQCKSAMGDLVDSYARVVGLSHAWARIFFVYGPGEPRLRLVSAIASSLLRKERVACSHGRQKRDFLFVEDVAEAFARLVTSPVTGAINVGSGQAVEVGQVIRTVAELVGRPDLIDWGARTEPLDSPVVEADTTRLRNDLRFAPSVSLEAGLARTIASLETS